MQKFKIFQLLLVIIFVFQVVNIKAQIGLAVAKNDNGSTVKYVLETGNDVNDAIAKAVKTLESQDAKNIFTLRSDKKTGHELSTGHYILILSSRKISGKFFLSYGLGASQESKEDAVKKAIVHLKEWDWGYENDFGYKIEKEGKIEDLFPTVKE